VGDDGIARPTARSVAKATEQGVVALLTFVTGYFLSTTEVRKPSSGIFESIMEGESRLKPKGAAGDGLPRIERHRNTFCPHVEGCERDRGTRIGLVRSAGLLHGLVIA